MPDTGASAHEGEMSEQRQETGKQSATKTASSKKVAMVSFLLIADEMQTQCVDLGGGRSCRKDDGNKWASTRR